MNRSTEPARGATSTELNRTSYDRIAAQWSSARAAFFAGERAYLDVLLEVVPEGATVLDLGCGTGRPMAQYVVSRGRRILGVDQSEAMLAIARARLPAERWVQARIEDYACDEAYAAAIVWDSLFHIPRAEHEPIRARVVRGLEPGGRLMLTLGGSDHPPFADYMFGHEFFYDSNTPLETERILLDLSCRLLVAEFMNLPDGGRDKGRYAIVAQKD